MKCLICRQADTTLGFATVTLDRDELTLVVKRVPAQVCPNCGEEYVDEDVASQLLTTAEQAAQVGVLVDIRAYAMA